MEITLSGTTEINVGTDDRRNKVIICVDVQSGIRIVVPLSPESAKLVGEALLADHVIAATRMPGG
jgi:hypothetical protein